MIPFINLKNIQSKLVPYDDVGARGSHLPLLKVEAGANVTPAKICGRRNSFRASKGSFPAQIVIFTCYVVKSISSNFPDALDAML